MTAQALRGAILFCVFFLAAGDLLAVELCLKSPSLAVIQPFAQAQQEAEQPAAGTPPLALGGLTWSSPQEGLDAARSKQQPVVLLLLGGGGPELRAKLTDKLLSAASVSKQLKKFTRIAVTGASPELEPFLGATAELQGIVLMDFGGTLLGRWQDKLPERRVFVNKLKQAYKRNAQTAQRYAEVTKAVKKSQYALKLKKYPLAVQWYERARKQKVPPKSPGAAEVLAVRAKIDELMAVRQRQAEEAEANGEYVAAINKYEQLLKDFPLPEKEKELRRNITRLWTYVNGVGG